MYYNDNTRIKMGENKMDISYTAIEDIKTKKISFNIEIQMLELVDDLAKLTKTNRTTVLTSLVGLGISSYVKSLRESWEKLKKSNPDKKAKIESLLKGLSKIENKHVKRHY